MRPLWELEHYVDGDGNSPIQLFVTRLSEDALVEAEALTKLLRQNGNEIKPGQMVSHGNDIYEIAGEYIRLFCRISKDRRVVLIEGFLPDEEAPLSDIQRKAELT